jgi:cell pole-organizing protein PopZ
MSSTERAPEPTMEEILASIRRIISDDESSSARQQTAPQSHSDEEGLESGEGEADDAIINDIARVLSGSGSPAGAEEEGEEILDLTAELGGLELVEDSEDVEEIELLEVVEETPPEFFNTAPARPRPIPVEVSSEFEADGEPELELLEEVAEEEVTEEPVPEAEAELAEAPVPEMQAPPAAPRQMSASEEAASALERAIAALRAGQVPTSSSPFSFQPPQPEPVFTPQPAPVFEPQPEPATAQPAPSFGLAPSFEPMPVPEPVSAQEPVSEPEGEPESELVLTEVEVEMIEDEPLLFVETVTSEPKVDRAWSMGTVPDWSSSEREGEAEEDEMPHVNGGGGYHAGAQKSLEDSVKDMLRPMLKQWLDENMSRVLTAALKDELKNNPARLRGE